MLICIVMIIIAILIFLGILKLINKFIFKNKVKINFKEIIIAWCIIFCFNFYCAKYDIPHPIGVTCSLAFDGGKVKYCFSLGYILIIEKSSIVVNDVDVTTTVDFVIRQKSPEGNGD